VKRLVLTWTIMPTVVLFLGFSDTRPRNNSSTVEVASESANWLMYGRTYNDQRFSPLNQINEKSVANLGLVWSQELDTTRGLEATPIVEDGVIYTTASWNVVYAMDAKSGKTLWQYDPRIDRSRSYFLCCDAVNRGVALYNDKLYEGLLDGRLIALDKRTGSIVWSTQTTDVTQAYSITGAPRIAKGMVVIGNAGAEYGVRGYISAYDAEAGKMAWRFYTVPGDPAHGFENKDVARAAKTWTGDKWKDGAGGSPWDSIGYDPALELLYFGTGNATAWYRALRGGGDNLYTASIVAVHASTGELAWYFQPTPGDNWDYDATQPLIQADLKIGGRIRNVLMQANKNGFFYVLDRKTGEFISGAPFVSGVTWASGLDPKTGRPIEFPGVGGAEPTIISPDPFGAHNWYPMAFHPATGLVYVPAKIGGQMVHAPDPKWRYDPNAQNRGINDSYEGALYAKADAMPQETGELLAWNPVTQKEAWHAKSPVVETGGVLTTGDNLIFQGRADGMLVAYRATDGKLLWQFDAGTGIMAPPVSFAVNGVQYVTVMAGWGGGAGLFNTPGNGPVKPGYGRILTFALGGQAKLSVPSFGPQGPPPIPELTYDSSPELVHKGAQIFNSRCMLCHGLNAVSASLPDLRYSSKEMIESLDQILLDGVLARAGMPSYKKILNAQDVKALQAYIVARARESATASPDKPKP
jgi:quinohemoprotein ethanol dehydrogenase